jgi:hypothetical protein
MAICRCSETVLKSWGFTTSLDTKVKYCNFCDNPYPGQNLPGEKKPIKFESKEEFGSKQTIEYKVITMKDRFFSGKFDPGKLELALNEYAKLGWKLRAVTTADMPGIGSREEIIFVLERVNS